MRYSRTKPLRRNAPSQSINLKLCRFATLGDGKTCTTRVQNITETAITKLFGRSPSRHPHVRRREHSACADETAITKLFGQSWTPFKEPSRHQRRLDCTRTPSTALRTRQLRASESQRFFGKGNAKIHWEQEQRPVKLRIWYGLFCMSIRALYFLFVLFVSNVVRVFSNSLSLLTRV